MEDVANDRAESPSNLEQLTSAFLSGSSDGFDSIVAAKTLLRLASKTRLYRQNVVLHLEALISCGSSSLLYPTCDLMVPVARSMNIDLFRVLDIKVVSVDA
jgi:hypothetical protein